MIAIQLTTAAIISSGSLQILVSFFALKLNHVFMNMQNEETNINAFQSFNLIIIHTEWSLSIFWMNEVRIRLNHTKFYRRMKRIYFLRDIRKVSKYQFHLCTQSIATSSENLNVQLSSCFLSLFALRVDGQQIHWCTIKLWIIIDKLVETDGTFWMFVTYHRFDSEK